MDENFILIFAIIGVIILVIIIAFIVEMNQPTTTTTLVGLPNNLRQRYEDCSTGICSEGLVCTRMSNGEQRCLQGNARTCFNNSDCSSGFCSKTVATEPGICRGLVTDPLPLPIPQPGIGTTQIYIRRGETWIPYVAIPSGLNLTRISASQGSLLGTSPTTNQLFLWDGRSWQDITRSFTPPGTLVDAVVSGADVWVVYRLSNGQTAVYRWTNGVLTPITPTSGGLQVVQSGQIIEISEIALDANGDIFLIGKTPGGQITLYRKTSTATYYQAITSGYNVAVAQEGDNYAFASGSSILLLGTGSSRQDNISGEIMDLAIGPNRELWYLFNNQLYRNGQVITAPIPINSQTRLFTTNTNEVGIFTPGY